MVVAMTKERTRKERFEALGMIAQRVVVEVAEQMELALEGEHSASSSVFIGRRTDIDAELSRKLANAKRCRG